MSDHIDHREFKFTSSGDRVPDTLAISEKYDSPWYAMLHKDRVPLSSIHQACAELLPVLTKEDLVAIADKSFGNVVCYAQAFRSIEREWDRFVLQLSLLRVAAGDDVLIVVANSRFARRLLETLTDLSKMDWLSANLGLRDLIRPDGNHYVQWSMNAQSVPATEPRLSGRLNVVSRETLLREMRGYCCDSMVLWEPERFFYTASDRQDFIDFFLEPFLESSYKELVVLTGKPYTHTGKPAEVLDNFARTFTAVEEQ